MQQLHHTPSFGDLWWQCSYPLSSLNPKPLGFQAEATTRRKERICEATCLHFSARSKMSTLRSPISSSFLPTQKSPAEDDRKQEFPQQFPPTTFLTTPIERLDHIMAVANLLVLRYCSQTMHSLGTQQHKSARDSQKLEQINFLPQSHTQILRVNPASTCIQWVISQECGPYVVT